MEIYKTSYPNTIETKRHGPAVLFQELIDVMGYAARSDRGGGIPLDLFDTVTSIIIRKQFRAT